MFKAYTQSAFLICAGILAMAGVSMSIAIKSFGVYLKKEPLPLKKSLDLLEEKALAPYKVVSTEKIENEEVIKALGTQDYIQWQLEDDSVPADSAVRYCLLLITYYGLPDLVPHVPEECYTGSGYQKLSSDSVVFTLNRDGHQERLPGTYVVFTSKDSDRWQGGTKFSVLYIFRANGEYTNNRTDTRIVLGKNLLRRYSYFSKVEIKFFNVKFGMQVCPSEEQAVSAGQKLLSVILPVLEKKHWPDWEKL
ncbi:MAG: EpsI family protein [Sedimentisphaerales bacterium]|nr:EpsI family protein [Sedimentisphaerales bacterium]